MKSNSRLFLLILPLMAFCLFALPGKSFSATGNVTAATMLVYKAYLYTSPTCSGTPEVIIDNGATPVAFDMTSNPTLGSANIADGTYKCFAFKMSDSVTFTSESTLGSTCVAGQSYTMDVCKPITNSGGGTFTPYYYDPDINNDPTQNAGYSACTTGTDKIWIFVSRIGTSNSSSVANPFAPPTSTGGCNNPNDPSTYCGMKLNNDIIVSGTTSGTFIFGTDNKVSDTANPGSCDMDAPDFGFLN